MEIRAVHPDEVAALGALTVAAYHALPGHVVEPAYDAELADVATRAEAAVVLVAVEHGDLLGGVTFVPDADHPMAEHGVDGAATIRMLAVSGHVQGTGVGRALVEACIERARAAGTRELALHSTPWMTTAHHLYARLGFRRDPSLDWTPVPHIELWAFRLDLTT